MIFESSLSKLLSNIQYSLFPDLKRFGYVSKDHEKIASLLEVVRIEEFLPCTRFNWGRPIKDRPQIARAFVAKIVLKIAYNKDLIERLNQDKTLRVICGWQLDSKIPSAAKFSRAFKEFSDICLPEKVHQALISEFYENKVICNLVKDSTHISVRESCAKRKGCPKERRKLLNNQQHKERKEGTSRKQKQLKQDLKTVIEDLPIQCDIGVKKGSQGHLMTCRGYKLHTAVDDNCVPIAAILTSASLNDSEVAIPLAEKSHRLATNFYDLMDSAYDAPEIIEHSKGLGHIPIIDRRARNKLQKLEKQEEKKRKQTLGVCTAEDRRYQERMPKERFHATLKDYYGARNILYRGHAKVFCHLMFGLLAFTAVTLSNLIT